ncbi:MAG TPA: hypothetical protein VIN59_03445 [Alphaproteobacteria bacterium]
MKLFQAVFMAALAVFVSASAAQAGTPREDFNANQVGTDSSVTLLQNRGNTYQEVTYEGNRKIITTYKAVGTRKVGLVGKEPYGLQRNTNLTDGGNYYTQDGVRYFRDSKSLDVEYQGSFND